MSLHFRSAGEYHGCFDARIHELLPMFSTCVEAKGIPRSRTVCENGRHAMILLCMTATGFRARSPNAGEWIRMAPGEGVIVAPFTAYEIDTTRDRSRGHHAWIAVEGLDMHRLGGVLKDRRFRLMEDARGALRAAFLDAVHTVENAGGHVFWPLQYHGRVILDLLAGAARARDRIIVDLVARPADPLVDRILTHLSTHLTESVTLRDLARHAGCAVSTLGHRYKAGTGESPLATLRRMRILASQKRLADGGQPKNVVEELHFYDAAHFSRVFRAATGESPAAFIRRMKATARISPTGLPPRGHRGRAATR